MASSSSSPAPLLPTTQFIRHIEPLWDGLVPTEFTGRNALSIYIPIYIQQIDYNLHLISIISCAVRCLFVYSSL